MVEGFYVAGFRAAFLGALILSIINILATFLISLRSGSAFVHFDRRNPGDY